METSDTETLARGVFAEIARRFPSLRMVENYGEPVEISITMPTQPGLTHQVWLCLQNHDELGFSVGHFYIDYFPCTKPARVERSGFGDGLLVRKYRILEHYRGGRCYKAQLQKPEKDRWCTIATWATVWIPIFLKKTVNELRNQ